MEDGGSNKAMSAKGDRAVEHLLKDRMNCAQSVLTVFCQELGLERNTALRLTMGFGGGEGHTGGTCGAVIGAYLVFGLQQQVQTDLQTPKDAAVARIMEFSRRFQEKHGSTLCPVILGYDLRLPEQFKQAWQSGAFTKRCAVFVRDAAEMLEKMNT
jgi:C_GCAxxG_C_C family probable redox protein